ncbi:NADP-dependent oxidoreductase [Thalassospira sp.]|uniref:NADP-dependent oxidoreductase n=1 Tax=Thalassospira sp. TaxID=1912094 RepID=UPI0027325154|nr:NADP-dependent oxidoreductase [Thalassospira sp.]MDP2698730.1 NADP-dependent oxidoreductase [Thalassospira sp.]
MKAVILDDYNSMPVIGDIAIPEIGPDDVLVRVVAAALNPLDVKLHGGVLQDYFPIEFRYVVGTDLAGRIEAVGANVTDWEKGDRIVARLDPVRGGACAGFACVPAKYLAKVPDTIPLETAAGIPTVAGTAWQALFELGDLKAGQTVLIHAGAGGVGSFAIQFARAGGARVMTTVSGDGIDIAHRLGADHVIDYRNANFAENLSDIDLVIDTIGGETHQRSFGVLRRGGKLLALVAPPDEALANAHNVTADFVFHMSDGERLVRVVSAIAENSINILTDRIVSLDAFSDAFARQSSGCARGKIIVTMA